MSEPVFFLLIFCSVLAFFMAFFRTHNRLLLVPSAVAGGAATLARFSAPPLSAAMGLALLANPRRTLRQRIADLLRFALIEGVIFIGWIGASAASNDHGIGREVRLYGNPDLERRVSGLKTLSTLIVPSMVPAVIRYALLVLALGLCIWLTAGYLGGVVRQWRGRRIVDDIVVPLVFGLFALFYIGFMIVAVYMEANLPISTRYALPFYIALVIAVTLAAGSLRFSSRGSVVTWNSRSVAASSC